MRDAIIVSAVRTPVGKAPKGTLRTTRPDEMAAVVIAEALHRAPGLEPAEIDDIILGCAIPEAEQGMNVARIASLRAGIPIEASAVTINRFCSSGLQAIAFASERIMCGSAETIIAGGTESMSLLPMGGHNILPNPKLVETYPDVYLSTGLVAEIHAREASISREEQDAFAFRSHRLAIEAIDAGRFTDETIPLIVTQKESGESENKPKFSQITFSKDEGPRHDTSLESLAKLKPAFHINGTITAGNSSQISDGASAVAITSSERATRTGLHPLGRFVAFATAGVQPERFGIGPVPAINKVLKLAGLKLDQIDLIELNEAFAAQVIACLRLISVDPDRLNVNGGAIALGHPLGCTGAKLTTTLLYELKRRGGRYGIVTMCVGGGMGAAAIFERV